MEKIAAKLFIAPIIPGKALAFSSYSHSGDVCSDCQPKFEKSLKKRTPRSQPVKLKKKKPGKQKIDLEG